MKTKYFLILGLALTLHQVVFSQLKVTNQGFVGCGTNTPWERLHVANGSAIIANNGRSLRLYPWSGVFVGSNYGGVSFWEKDYKWNHVVASSFYTVSDEILKTAIQEIENPILLLKNLEGVYFKYKNDSVIAPFELKDEFNYGFIAQEVENVIPEIVKETDLGVKAVDYIAIIPILVEGFKQQQLMIEAQQQQLDSFKVQLESCCQADSQQFRTSNIINDESGTLPTHSIHGTGILFQNNPNPFKEKTTIKYQIKENYSEASILIFDMQGLLLKRIPINNQLNGEITIQGSELKPGMYIYSLIVDKKEVDTKRMILLD
ncbi:MAG: hypothetical protein A3K10_10355 [Bacteroidetes bacterium RIFCSPLOWO2_12_FULL_31_6]|nr:MAG: hypothetical protein A3K10_10355 [Bacteroidetes bacterium RIFCSPLOWO2_12_FULL_31_6]